MIKWTTQCGGDIGLTIGDHQVVVMAFILTSNSVHREVKPTPYFALNIYDIIKGGEPKLLPLAEGLTYMEALAATHALKLVGPHQSDYYTRLDPGTQRELRLTDSDWPDNGAP